MTTPPPPAGPASVRPAWPLFLFAFGTLLASYPARNADIWVHLAAGRDIATGAALANSFTPLFDALAYLGFVGGGGALLVAVKAVATGLLGVVLYGAARTGSARALPAVVVGLALMAVSLRANLQPHTASYLLLGVTGLWLARRPGPPTWRDWLPLAVLFVAWANLDRGVVYGLALVVLTYLGRALDATRTPGPPTGGRTIAVALLALVAASLLNPAHVGGFPLPVELHPLTGGDAADVARSPLTPAYVRSVADSPAALAYYPLLALTVAGAALNRRGFRWSRFLPAAAFGLISALTDRAVPLFAVVAAPAAALDLSEALARRGRVVAAPRWRRGLAVAGATAVAGLFLVVAWPGWLQRPPYEPRRWAFDLPTAAAAAADTLRTLGPGRTLHLTAESRTAFRWACPEDDGQFDAGLAADLADRKPVAAAMRAGGFTRLAVYDPDPERVRPALNALLRDRYAWPLVALRGGVAVFGWRDPDAAGDSWADREIDLSQLWPSGLEAGRVAVPPDGPAPPPATWVASLREKFTRPRELNSPARDEAALLMVMAEVSRRWVPQLNGLSWYFEHTAGLAGGAASWAGPGPAAADAAFRLSCLMPPDSRAATGTPSRLSQAIEGQFDHAVAAKDDFLPATVPAAVRAGRRAVAADPLDARAHLALGEAYLTLLLESRERVWGAEFKQLRELRQAQAAAALRRAVELSPGTLPKAHRLLSLMYRRIGYLDLALDQLDAARRVGGTDPDAEAQREVLLAQLDLVRGRFAEQSPTLRVADQAALAAQLGLHGLALELLLKSDIAAFGLAGLRLELEHLVRTGRADQVIRWTSPEQRDAVGARSYHWLRAQAFAALGDYAAADRELARIGGESADFAPDPALLAASAAAIAARHALGEAALGGGLPDAFRRAVARTQAAEELASLDARLKNLAEVCALRGVLALEIGDRPAAAREGERTLFFVPTRPGAASPLRGLGRSLIDRADVWGK